MRKLKRTIRLSIATVFGLRSSPAYVRFLREQRDRLARKPTR